MYKLSVDNNAVGDVLLLKEAGILDSILEFAWSSDDGFMENLLEILRVVAWVKPEIFGGKWVRWIAVIELIGNLLGWGADDIGRKIDESISGKLDKDSLTNMFEKELTGKLTEGSSSMDLMGMLNLFKGAQSNRLEIKKYASPIENIKKRIVNEAAEQGGDEDALKDAIKNVIREISSGMAESVMEMVEKSKKMFKG